jgi:hypothetical protein
MVPRHTQPLVHHVRIIALLAKPAIVIEHRLVEHALHASVKLVQLCHCSYSSDTTKSLKLDSHMTQTMLQAML